MSDARDKILEKTRESKGNLLALGQFLAEMAVAWPAAGDIIAADLKNEKMGIAAAFAHLTAYAKQHQSGGSWCCVPSLEPDNEMVKIMCDFYHIPPEALQAATPEQQADADLFDFL